MLSNCTRNHPCYCMGFRSDSHVPERPQAVQSIKLLENCPAHSVIPRPLLNFCLQRSINGGPQAACWAGLSQLSQVQSWWALPLLHLKGSKSQSAKMCKVCLSMNQAQGRHCRSAASLAAKGSPLTPCPQPWPGKCKRPGSSPHSTALPCSAPLRDSVQTRHGKPSC